MPWVCEQLKLHKDEMYQYESETICMHSCGEVQKVMFRNTLDFELDSVF